MITINQQSCGFEILASPAPLIMRVLVTFFCAFAISPSFCTETLVLVAADSPPTGYMVNEKPSGILVDIINEVFSRTKQPIKIKLQPWARCLAEIQAGTVDGIFSVYNTQERQQFLTYSSEILITQVQAFFVRRESTIVFDGDFKKIANSPIGIIRQTSYGVRFDAALKDGTFSNIDFANTAEINIKKLLAKRVELIPSFRIVALSTAKEIGVLNEIKELSPTIESVPSYLAFTNKRDYAKIISDYDKALQAMKRDGSYDSILKKYLQ